MNKKLEEELYKLAEEYTLILHDINLFIINNNLDYDEIWDKCNQYYDEDLSICNENN